MRYLILGLLSIPLFELCAHAWIVRHVPAVSEYRAASDFIRAGLEPGDVITSAPAFTDPILRWQLGDRVPLAMAGRSDDARYERMWVLSIRGALPAGAPQGQPELQREFGRVRVLRYRLRQPARVLFDFVEAWERAEASIVRGGVPTRCPLRVGGTPRGGGLGKGVLLPVRRRFECDPRSPALFIAPVVLEGLDNEPRYCIWQHPQGEEPVSLSFRDVPLGDELRLYAGLYYEHERMREGAPIEVSVAIDGRERAHFTHRDGEGFQRWTVPTAGSEAATGEVTLSVRTSDSRGRSFCWAGETLRANAGGSP